jgi:predicted O-methyltransferase YrrM
MDLDNGDSLAIDKSITDISEMLKRIKIPPETSYISIRPAEGEFLYRWVKEHGLSRTLEVGMAYGASAASIMSAHQGIHTCMDPFQNQFDNLGLQNLASLGYRPRLDFHLGFSHDVLPSLVAAKRNFDFAFIDGDHRFDGIFVDFFYVDLLLQDRGYVVFHDAWMRGTQLVASFIRRNRKDYRRLRCPVRNMILFQKIGQDQRAWHHFREFYTWKGIIEHRAIVWMHLGFLKKIFGYTLSKNETNREISESNKTAGWF